MTHGTLARALLTSALVAVAAPTAWAQTATVPTETEGALDEIVVVARKREERLQDVPIAVSAFTAADLEKSQTSDIGGLQGAVPNLNIVQGRGSSASANVFIRGIGQPDALQTFDPGVGIYVDGVYLSRIQGALLTLFDVERVEVLRGPQGTLYGKNTIGGAVNVVSRKPGDELAGRFAASYGRFDALQLNGYLAMPLVEGKLAISAAATYDKRDGTTTDLTTGRKYNDRDTVAGRLIVRATPAEGLEVIIAGDITKIDTALTLGRAEAPLTQTVLAGVPPVFTLVPAPTGTWNRTVRTSFRGNEGQEVNHKGLSLTVNAEATDWLTLTSISAYRVLKPELFIDIDATQVETGDVKVFIDQNQFSQELQAKVDFDRLKGVVGLYYMRENLSSQQEAYADDLFSLLSARLPITFTRFITDEQKTDSYAAFSQFTYDLTDQFAITAGLRYTKESKDYRRSTFTTSSFAGLNLPAFTIPDAIPAPFNTQFGGDGSASWDAWTPSVTLDFKPMDDVLVYATVARGFKSGGFNGRANALADIVITDPVSGQRRANLTFNPETVWTYEAGLKSTVLDGRLRFNASAFYSDYKNFQARVGGPDAGSFPVINAGKLEIYGFEMEALAKPVPALTLAASVGYLSADYKEFFDTRQPPSPSCNPTRTQIVCEPAFAPKWNLRLAADYAFDLGAAGVLTLGADLRHVSSHFLSVDNRRPALFEDGYTLLNAQARWNDADNRLFATIGGKNLLNEIYKTDGQEFSNVGNIQTAYYGDPVTWSLTIGVNF
jgi:iron complex outermembrane receptor protein